MYIYINFFISILTAFFIVVTNTAVSGILTEHLPFEWYVLICESDNKRYGIFWGK